MSPRRYKHNYYTMCRVEDVGPKSHYRCIIWTIGLFFPSLYKAFICALIWWEVMKKMVVSQCIIVKIVHSYTVVKLFSQRSDKGWVVTQQKCLCAFLYFLVFHTLLYYEKKSLLGHVLTLVCIFIALCFIQPVNTEACA